MLSDFSCSSRQCSAKLLKIDVRRHCCPQHDHALHVVNMNAFVKHIHAKQEFQCITVVILKFFKMLSRLAVFRINIILVNFCIDFFKLKVRFFHNKLQAVNATAKNDIFWQNLFCNGFTERHIYCIVILEQFLPPYHGHYRDGGSE